MTNPETSNQMSAFERNQNLVHAFFEQYMLIEQEFDTFSEERKQLFSQTSSTIVNDDGVSIIYSGKEGHILSLEDWFSEYQVGDDFGYEILDIKSDSKIEVKMKGSLTKSTTRENALIKADEHNWMEYFEFNDNGKIVRFQVDMNISNETEAVNGATTDKT